MSLENQPFTPYQLIELEISRELPRPVAAGNGHSQHVLALVRLHSQPLGQVEVEFEHELPAEVLAQRIWEELGDGIREHLRQDGLPVPERLTAGGISSLQTPLCLQARENFLRNAPYATVVIATHNRVSTLGPCLDSLLRMDYPNFDIVVMDNAPANEDTRDFITSKYLPTRKVRYVREERPGLASAHNAGLAVTTAPYLAITDDDVIVDRNWLCELVKGFFQAEQVGCVTGMIFPAEVTTEAQYLLERSVGYTKGYSRKIFDLHHNRPDHPLFPYAAGMFGSGANMAFDTRIIRQLGGFDDGLGAGSVAKGGDDLASFFQVVASGYTLVYEPAAIIYHRHDREYKNLRKTAYGYGAGLTAYLTKIVIDQPTRVLEMAQKIPYGLYYALNSHSPKNERKVENYPQELTQLERKGMLVGPILYLRSRWRTRNWKLQRRQAIRRENSVRDTGKVSHQQ